jgi:hypothetical protein
LLVLRVSLLDERSFNHAQHYLSGDEGLGESQFVEVEQRTRSK